LPAAGLFVTELRSFLLQELVLFFRQLERRVATKDTDEKIASSPAAKAGDTVAGDLEDAAGLHSRRDRKEIGPIERVQLGLCAERGLGNRQVQCPS